MDLIEHVHAQYIKGHWKYEGGMYSVLLLMYHLLRYTIQVAKTYKIVNISVFLNIIVIFCLNVMPGYTNRIILKLHVHVCTCMYA